MIEYNDVRNNLICLLKSPNDEDYDAVFYFIGGKDYDVSNLYAVNAVADMILTKATVGTKKWYIPKNSGNIVGVYSCCEDISEHDTATMERARAREVKEEEARAAGTTYIPHSPRLETYICQALLVGKQALGNNYGNGQQYENTVGYKTWKSFKETSRNLTTAEIIFGVFIILWVIAELMAM